MTALFFLALLALSSQQAHSALTSVRVAFLTDCKWYSDWQSLGMIYSFKMSGQPGKVTRVMCCSEEEKKKYPQELLHEVDTHIAPSYTVHPVTHDSYAAYNKPEAVIDWLQHVTPEEEYILVLDSDMILRRPFLVEQMHPSPGMAVGAKYTYMIGVNNELAMRHVPEVQPRNDTLAGPYGRRGDQVGGFFFIHRDDLKRMSTLWLKYTEDVRADPMAYKYSGDVYAIHPGDKPWISEMYGYAFGAAKADVWHTWDANSMIYPEYEPHGMPKLMHYGLLFNVAGYKFDKHWHYDFDVNKCPPWDFSQNSMRRNAGLFEQPPHFSTLTTKDQPGLYYRDLLSIETVATLNAGFCDYHVRHCPPSEQLYSECKKAWEFYKEITTEVKRLESNLGCLDLHAKCEQWAAQGECTKNKEYMDDTCKKSCGVCVGNTPLEGLTPASNDLERNLAEMEKKLAASRSPSSSATDPDTANAKLVQGIGSADPDAKAQSSSPAEQAAIPRIVNSPAAHPSRVVQSPAVVARFSSHPSPAPVNTPSPVPESNPTIQGQQSGKSHKDLVVACYRMTLTLDEVKECCKAALAGIEYRRPRQERVLNAGADVLQADALASTEDAGKLAPQQLRPSKPDARSGFPWRTAGLLLVVAVLALFVGRRIVRFRRRARSGMRSE